MRRKPGPPLPKLKDIWKECKAHGILQDEWEFTKLLSVMRRNKIKSVLEIGCYEGGTALAFLKLGCSVLSVDKEHRAKVELLRIKHPGQYAFVQGDSHDQKTVDEAIRMKPDYDMVLIDGAHDITSVSLDYKMYGGLARKLIVFHDIKDTPQTRAINHNVGPVWQEVKKGKEWREIMNAEIHNCGFGIIFL